MNHLHLLLALIWAVNGFTLAWAYTRGRTIVARHYVAAGVIVVAVCTVLAELVLDAPRLYWNALAVAAPVTLGAWAGLTVGRYVPPLAPYEASATAGPMWWVVPFGLLLGTIPAIPIIFALDYRFAYYMLALSPLYVVGHALLVRRHRRVVAQKRREPVLRIDG